MTEIEQLTLRMEKQPKGPPFVLSIPSIVLCGRIGECVNGKDKEYSKEMMRNV
jgi:hypothetical protein